MLCLVASLNFLAKTLVKSVGAVAAGFMLFYPLLHSGFIKNTEKLSYGKERMYKLTVTAYDCGKNRASEDVLVKISVKPTCKPSWQGVKASLCLFVWVCPSESMWSTQVPIV